MTALVVNRIDPFLDAAVTVRFEWLNRAARLVAPAGAQILRLATNAAVQDTVTRALSGLDQAA